MRSLALCLCLPLILAGCSSSGHSVVRIRTHLATGQGALVAPDRVLTVGHVVPEVGSTVWVSAPYGAWIRAVVVSRSDGWADILLESPAYKGWSGSPVYAWIGSVEGGLR